MAEVEESASRVAESPEQNGAVETPDPPAHNSTKPAHEESPLLSASETGDEEQEGLIEDESTLDDNNEDSESKSIWYLILLTISIGGLQLAWAVELSNGSPYLLSLGLSKSLMALVWIAGPLSGTLVQPYVGILSDNCRSPWGKRTPFMATGSVATVISLLALAWVKEIVGGFLGLFGADRESNGVKVSIIIVAVLFVYILDFSINTGRSSPESRASLADISKCKQVLELSS
jgi:solute carrier family 45, member 1/2/4